MIMTMTYEAAKATQIRREGAEKGRSGGLANTLFFGMRRVISARFLGAVHLRVPRTALGSDMSVCLAARLTVRRVQGPNPARAIIDPHGRLPLTARAMAADGMRRLVITAATTPRQP